MNEENKELKKHSDFRKLCKPIKVSKFLSFGSDIEAHFETLDDYFKAIVKVGIPNKITTMGIPIFQKDFEGRNSDSAYYCISPSGVILVYEFKTAELADEQLALESAQEAEALGSA